MTLLAFIQTLVSIIQHCYMSENGKPEEKKKENAAF